MLKIVEIRRTLTDTKLIDNIYDVQNTIQKIVNQLEFSLEINEDDYNFLNIIIEKTKNNLDKAYMVIKN